MLKITHLDLHYGRSQILYDVSLSAEVGQITCVMGNNGVGKTSLLKAISGVHARSSGEYEFEGRDVARYTPAHVLAKRGVGYVPQGRDIFPLMTVRENLETGFACLDRTERRVPDEIFELFPVLGDMGNRRGGDLSGGQQQQLAIGRALVARPKLLLLDEPTEGIQPNIITQIGEVIQLLRDRGDMAIILVEQFFDFAYEIGDSFNVLNQGRIVLQKSAPDTTRTELLASVSLAETA